MFRSNTDLRSVVRMYWSFSVSRFGRIRTTLSVGSSAFSAGLTLRHRRQRPVTASGFITAPSSSRRRGQPCVRRVQGQPSVDERNLLCQLHLDQGADLVFYLDV